jgi:hypothetical protein
VEDRCLDLGGHGGLSRLCLVYLGVQFVRETGGERQLEIKQEQVKGNK